MKGIHTILFISLVFLASCNQDPIFTMISNEVEPKDPLINGSPSKIVKTSDGTIYVANGKLWKYSGGGWSQAGGPSNVYDIAAAGTDLYMLSISESGGSVYKRGTSGTDTQIPNNSGYSMIQGIYSDGAKLYAGGMNGGAYAILHIDSNNVLRVKDSIGSPLTGVARDYYATARGVYTINENTPVNSTSGYTIAGIIEAEVTKNSGSKKIIAVSSGGMVFVITSTTSVETHDTGYNFTGALAVYTPSGSSSNLLLIGVKGAVYNLGYREAWVDGSDNFALRSPGGSTQDSSIRVEDKDKYSATLAKCAVNSLIQAGDSSDGWPVIFASTQKDGLWSYRNNEWNAEE